MSIDTELTNEVMAPWHDECREADFPWMATPRLRAKWRTMASSTCSVTSFVGAFGLCRAADLSYDERMAVERFFYSYDGSVVSHNATLLAMFTGASLAHAYCQTSLSARIPKPGSAHEHLGGLISLVSNYLRHPDSARLPLAELLPDADIKTLWYAAAANPLTPPPIAGTDDWELALRIFKTSGGIDGKFSDFHVFAHLLRATHTGEYVRKKLRASLLIQPYASVIEVHPALSRGPCPDFEHENPRRVAISYFSMVTNPFCAIWRFYNPLLISPWIMNVVDPKQNAGVLAGVTLLGSPALDADMVKGQGFPDLSSRLRNHPSQHALALF